MGGAGAVCDGRSYGVGWRLYIIYVVDGRMVLFTNYFIGAGRKKKRSMG